MNLVSSRLAARAGTRQLDALAHTNSIADRADAEVTRLWKQLTALLAREAKRREQSRQLATPHSLHREVADIIAAMHRAAHAHLSAGFHRLAQWGHASAADIMVQTLPVAYLRSVANERNGRNRHDGGISHHRLSYHHSGGNRLEAKEPSARFATERHFDFAGRTFPDFRQSTDFSCGASVIRSVCRHFDVGPRSERDFIRLVQADPERGTRVADIRRIADACGLTVRELRGPQQLAAYVRAGWPVICPVQVHDRPEDERGREEAGHYVVAIRAYRKLVKVQDPLYGRRFALWPDFIRDWHDHDDDGRRYIQFGLAFMRQRTDLERKRLMEDEPDRPDPGTILLRLGLGGQLDVRDVLGRLREPVRQQLSDQEQRALLGRLLFPPLPFERIVAILRHPVAGLSWEQDLRASTRLADPNVVAGIVAGGFAAGMNHVEVARLLRPAVQGVKSTARRVARTYGMEIAHRAQQDAHAAVDDLIVGWQVHALLDQHTRTWHAARSGEIYYRQPSAGQKGMRQCPHPPLEAEDAGERPPGTPRLAWH